MALLTKDKERVSEVWPRYGRERRRISMSYSRGDIVIVPFPFVLESGRQEQKARPALVVSDDTTA